MNLAFLPMLLAQASDVMPTDQPQVPQLNPAALGVSMVITFGIMFLIFALMLWKVFTKAGYPGWASLIPLYNMYVLCKIGGKPGWWLILMFIPLVNFIILILVCIGVAENFGKGAGFGVGLAFLGIIFFPILGFGDARYQGAPPLPNAV